MSGKIIQLEYISPRCEKCGRDLPKSRKKQCFYCLPPGGHHKKVVAVVSASLPEEYTLADQVAQADAYGMSYGKFMSFIENKWPLPPMRRPIRWPPDSEHFGEEK